MSVTENVKVAVRVRPFNGREKERNSKCIVEMSQNTTIVSHPSQPDKKKPFTFDYSYWSHDGYIEEKDGYFSPDPSHPNGKKFADQKRVFDELGQGILKNAFEGYNSTLFAYGQTGSGKSWSIIGVKPNDGIVPMLCKELFKNITEKRRSGNQEEFEVKLSMLEIYNEIVRDLLNPNASNRGLKVRERPNRGFYAEGLTDYPVASYEMITQKMEEGKTNRTIHATRMNVNSSRAHTIVGITFNQKHKNNGGDTTKSAIINLVDLAGSERVSKSGATGNLLKEGAAINLSLSTLGDCIQALAGGSKSSRGQVPYRDSQLTKLLANALSGNSKTIMIAAISPADWNYEETLTTLRYADRAKQIQTHATINEDPTDKLIRVLMEENSALKLQLESGKMPSQLNVGDNEDIEKVRQKYEENLNAAMLENERKIEDLRKSFEEKLKCAEKDKGPSISSVVLEAIEKDKKTKPHFLNLNIDPQLSGRIVHILKKGSNSLGNQKGSKSDIVITGPSILENHVAITWTENDEVFLEPTSAEARVLYNGDVVTQKIVLHHNDRVMFGAIQLYVFCHPKERDSSGLTYTDVDYNMAQEEIACKAGIVLPTPGDSQNLDNALLQEDLLGVMPAVQEANSISAELDKRVKFEIVLLPLQLIGCESSRSEADPSKCIEEHHRYEVCIKMKNLENGQEFVWHKEKFLNRLYMMKEMYANYEDDDAWELPEDEDPFTESPDTEVHIGSVQVCLQPLAFMVELKEQLPVTDYKGNEIGLLNVEVVPCSPEGKEYTEQDDMFVDTPDELVGRNISFVVKILSARGVPNRYVDICCKYRIYLENEDTKTSVVSEPSNAKFNHARIISFQPATKEVVRYLRDSSFIIHIVGKQHVRKSAMIFSRGKSTREMLKNDHDIMARTKNLMGGFNINGRLVDPQKQSIVVELLLMKKQQCRLQQRLDAVKKLVEAAQKMGRKTVPLFIMKDVMNACSMQSVDRALLQLEGVPEDNERLDQYNSRNHAKSSLCILL